LVEVLAVVGILALLFGVLLPALRAAWGSGRMVRCAAGMREIGMGLSFFADSSDDAFPTSGGMDWNSAYAATIGTGFGGNTWIGAVQRSLGRDSSPWLVPLRCPETRSFLPGRGRLVLDENSQPGSAWMMNFYCLGRKRSSIPSPADGMLVMESAFWTNTADVTGMLAWPQAPEAYPHTSLASGPARGAWGWDYVGRKRNLLWCDGHVTSSPTRRWPNGDQPFDPDRIRHMRFNLPGTHPLDP
jgi:prepilin-type processing-associated H-X9-DG protein